MKRDNVNYLWVGSFVLLMAAVLFYALYRVTGQRGQGDPYFTHFSNVAGIKTGTVVTYEGFEVGNVVEIAPVERDGRTAFRLSLRLGKTMKIPVDSRAVIASPGLLSAPLVEIKEGKSRDVLAVGGEIAGGSVPNLMESMALLASELGKVTESSIKPMLAQLNQHVTPAMTDLRSLLERVNRSAGRVDALFSDENVRHWGRMLKNGEGASANALQLVADLSQLRAEIEALVSDSRGLVGDSKRLVSDSRGLVSGGGKDVRELLRRVDATLYQLEAAGRHLNEFSRNIRENPAVLLNGKPPVDNAGVPQ